MAMMIVRNSQLQDLRARKVEDFHDRLRKHLRRVFPDKAAPLEPEELAHRIAMGLEKASEYKLVSELELTLFLDLVFGLGPDFDEQPRNQWMVQTLERKDLDNFEKLDKIYDRLAKPGAA
jgi:hypothetical protein